METHNVRVKVVEEEEDPIYNKVDVEEDDMVNNGVYTKLDEEYSYDSSNDGNETSHVKSRISKTISYDAIVIVNTLILACYFGIKNSSRKQ